MLYFPTSIGLYSGMAKTPEKKVKDEVVRVLQAAEVYYFFPVQTGYGRAGIPDIVCCANGMFLAIECKAGKGTTTSLQDYELRKIRDAGGAALVIREGDMSFLKAFVHHLKTLRDSDSYAGYAGSPLLNQQETQNEPRCTHASSADGKSSRRIQVKD